MQSIAAITAPNLRYKNPGMATVDLGFEAVRRRLEKDVEVDWYTCDPAAANIDELTHSYAWLVDRLEEVYDHDVIVFWGDFLHARHYYHEYASTRADSLGAAGYDEAIDTLHRCLLLRDAPDAVLRRTLSYGSTILFNSQSDYADSGYGPAFLRFIGGCRAVWMREPLSAAKGLLGSDALPLPTSDWSEEIDDSRVGVFIGSRTKIPRGFVGFCRDLAGRFGARPEWFPWFTPRGRIDRQRITRERLSWRDRPYTTGDLLAAVSRYRFVITDTYHVCVNAWRLGTPAVCLGSDDAALAARKSTLSDLKKQVLYSMYDASDFYLPVGAAIRKRAERVERLAALLRSDAAAAVTARMRSHAERAAAQLRDAILAVLDGARATG